MDDKPKDKQRHTACKAPAGQHPNPHPAPPWPYRCGGFDTRPERVTVP